MEATIQSTNRAINIDINVSINVDALKAIIQRWLQAIKQRVLSVVVNWLRRYCSRSAIDASITALASSQHSSLFTPFPTDGRLPVAFHSSLKLSLPRLYRMVLLMSRAAVRTIDAHPTISNIFLWTMCAACFWAVLTYNFTTHI